MIDELPVREMTGLLRIWCDEGYSTGGVAVADSQAFGWSEMPDSQIHLLLWQLAGLLHSYEDLYRVRCHAVCLLNEARQNGSVTI